MFLMLNPFDTSVCNILVVLRVVGKSQLLGSNFIDAITVGR